MNFKINFFSVKIDVVKGKVHKEILGTFVTKGFCRSLIHTEVVWQSILLSTIIYVSGVVEGGAGLITINVIQTDDLGTMQGQPVDLGFGIGDAELTTTATIT